MKKLRTSAPHGGRRVVTATMGFSGQALERLGKARRYEQNLEWQR